MIVKHVQTFSRLVFSLNSLVLVHIDDFKMPGLMDLPSECLLLILEENPLELRAVNRYFHRLHNALKYESVLRRYGSIVDCDPSLQAILQRYIKSLEQYRYHSRVLIVTLPGKEYLDDSWFIIESILRHPTKAMLLEYELTDLGIECKGIDSSNDNCIIATVQTWLPSDYYHNFQVEKYCLHIWLKISSKRMLRHLNQLIVTFTWRDREAELFLSPHIGELLNDDDGKYYCLTLNRLPSLFKLLPSLPYHFESIEVGLSINNRSWNAFLTKDIEFLGFDFTPYLRQCSWLYFQVHRCPLSLMNREEIVLNKQLSNWVRRLSEVEEKLPIIDEPVSKILPMIEREFTFEYPKANIPDHVTRMCWLTPYLCK